MRFATTTKNRLRRRWQKVAEPFMPPMQPHKPGSWKIPTTGNILNSMPPWSSAKIDHLRLATPRKTRKPGKSIILHWLIKAAKKLRMRWPVIRRFMSWQKQRLDYQGSMAPLHVRPKSLTCLVTVGPMNGSNRSSWKKIRKH